MVLVVGTYISHNYSSFNVYLVFLAALSMGIQYTCAKQVNRMGVITTMVTGTLSSLVSRLVDQSKNTALTTGAAHVKHEYLYTTETTVFLASVWGGYFVGGVSSVALLSLTSRIVGTILAALIGYEIVAIVYNQWILVLLVFLFVAAYFTTRGISCLLSTFFYYSVRSFTRRLIDAPRCYFSSSNSSCG